MEIYLVKDYSRPENFVQNFAIIWFKNFIKFAPVFCKKLFHGSHGSPGSGSFEVWWEVGLVGVGVLKFGGSGSGIFEVWWEVGLPGVGVLKSRGILQTLVLNFCKCTHWTMQFGWQVSDANFWIDGSQSSPFAVANFLRHDRYIGRWPHGGYDTWMMLSVFFPTKYCTIR